MSDEWEVREHSGFQSVEFKDECGVFCDITQSVWSSDGSSYLWLGRRSDRMHLDRELAARLRDVLTVWLETGKLRREIDAE